MKTKKLNSKKSAFISVIGTGVVVILCILSCGGNSSRTSTGEKQENDELFTLINVNVPDSVVFTIVEGKKIDQIEVSLVSSEQTFAGKLSVEGRVRLSSNYAGGFTHTSTDSTILTVKNFETPADYKAQKIEFKYNVDGTVLYYDIAQSKWE
ncbi:MAG: hypothetical protein LBU62_06065 [Bacteroidales bacterium]|jgi:hypothetical protein|nr:hypothetical protein [Bacteroidales bacterium]